MVLGLALRVVSEPLHSHVFLFWLGLAGSASELVAIKTANLTGRTQKECWGSCGRDWREQFAVLGAGGNNPVTGGKMDWTNPPAWLSSTGWKYHSELERWTTGGRVMTSLVATEPLPYGSRRLDNSYFAFDTFVQI
jgi:hypothetical protein